MPRRLLLAALVALSLPACEQLLGLDELEDPGVDGGADDSDDGVGDPCSVAVMEMANMDGTCQLPDTYCEGGTYPMDESGGCADGQKCCIDTDQCEKFASVGLSCEPGDGNPCAPGDGWIMGCPDEQWCCAAFDL